MKYLSKLWLIIIMSNLLLTSCSKPDRLSIEMVKCEKVCFMSNPVLIFFDINF